MLFPRGCFLRSLFSLFLKQIQYNLYMTTKDKVKEIQKIVNVTVDGIFGRDT